MKRTFLLSLPLLLAAGPASPDPAQRLVGRYAMDVQEGFMDSKETYTGLRIAEIVPVAPRAAYVRVALDYFNGHSCDISGVAKAEGDALVYRDPDTSMAYPESSSKQCVLTVRRVGKSLRIDDGDESCHSYCGARGTLSNVSLPYASKRPIRYLDRLKRSAEYRAAITEWKTGRPAE